MDLKISGNLRKNIVLGLILVASIGIGTLVNSSLNSTQVSDIDDSEWRNYSLETVESGKQFTFETLEKPLLIESFAVWCPTCTKQQKEIKELHNRTNITSVSIDVDPNEDRRQVIQHKRENNFDWRYTISPSELTRTLTAKFGNSIANPPSTPVILVCDNGSRKLENGVKTSDQLIQEVEKGC